MQPPTKRRRSEVRTLLGLPPELILECLAFLSVGDLALRVSLVCSSLRDLSSHNTLWEARLHALFRLVPSLTQDGYSPLVLDPHDIPSWVRYFVSSVGGLSSATMKSIYECLHTHIPHLSWWAPFGRLVYAWKLARVRNPRQISLGCSKFGGDPFLLSDESWPVCKCCPYNPEGPSDAPCGSPMTFFFQLHSSDLPTNDPRSSYFPQNSLLQLFVCVREFCDGEESICLRLLRDIPTEPPYATGREPTPSERQKLRSAGVREVIEPVVFRSWVPRADFPPANELEHFVVELLEGQIDDIYDMENVGDAYDALEGDFDSIVPLGRGDKLFGYPDWVQSRDVVTCGRPECEAEKMKYVIQIDSECTFDWMIGDCGTMQILICPKCGDVEPVVQCC